MQLRVAPDDIAASAARLDGDGPTLRGLAALLASSRGTAAAALAGSGRLAGAVDTFLDSGATGLGILAETADLLAGGLRGAAEGYRATDDAAARALRAAHG